MSYAGFQQNLNLLGATAHATTDELARASDVSKKLGADLTLPATSASDAAQAMTQLARGGLDATDAINAARGALQLSAAASISVADASLITAKNINAFALAGTDATKVVDILTNAYTHSGVGIEEFANGLSNVSAVAHLNGISLADVSTALAELTKKGVDASTAGTELRAVIIRMAAPTGPAADAMKALGINIFDAKGQMLPFRDVIDILSKSISNLSQQQQDQAFKQIFGNRAIGEALILASNGVASFDQMSAAINTAGSAADIAGARMKGLSGTLEGVKSQVETIGISVGQIFAPAAQLVLSSLTSVSSDLTDFSSEVAAVLTPVVVTRYVDTIVTEAKRVADAFHGIEGPAIGVATAIGSGFASQIPIIGAFFPEIAPLSGLLIGTIAQSDKARDALAGFGGALFSIGKDSAPIVLDALRELESGAGTAFAAIFTGGTKAAQILGPVLGGAIKDLAPPLSDLIANGGKLAGAVLPDLASAAGIAGNAIKVVLVPGLTLASDGLGLLAKNSAIVVPVLAGIAAIKFTGFVTEFVSGIGVVEKFTANLATSQKVIDGWAGAFNILPAQASKLEAFGATAAEVGGEVNVAFLGIGVVVAGLTAVLLKNASEARANQKAINDFRDAIVAAGDAVQGTENRVTEIVKGSVDLQHALVDAHTNATDLGDALAGTDAQFQSFEGKLITAAIATTTLSQTMKDALTKALVDTGGNVAEFHKQMDALGSGLGENTFPIDQLIDNLGNLRSTQIEGVSAADLQSRANASQAKTAQAAADAIDNQRAQLDKLAQATLDAISSQVGQQRNTQDATRAVQDQAKAQGDLLRVLGDKTSTQADGLAAQRDFEDANNRVTDSLRAIGAGAVEAAQNQAVLEGKSKDSVNALSVYRQAILDAAAANPALTDSSKDIISQLDATAAKAPGAASAIGAGISTGFVDGLQPESVQEGLAAMLRIALAPSVGTQAEKDAAAIGADIARGVANGINTNGDAILAGVQLVRDIITQAKHEAGIKSPSKVAQDEIGVPLAQGVAAGILAAIPESQAAGQAVIGAVLAGMRKSKADVQAELLDIGNQIQAKVAEIRGTSQTLTDAARVNAGVAAAVPFPELVAHEIATRVQTAQNQTASDSIEKVIQDAVNQQLLASGAIVKGINDPDTVKAQQDAASKAISDAAAAQSRLQQQEFDHNMITAQQYLTDLNEQLGKLSPLTDGYFTVLDEITSVNKSITDAQTQASQAQNDQLDAVIHREQQMYDHQLLAADAFLADLQTRMGQVTQFSDAYFSLLDEVNKVKADQVAALAAQTAASATGKTFLVSIDNNGQNLDEARLAELLSRTARVTPDAFAVM